MIRLSLTGRAGNTEQIRLDVAKYAERRGLLKEFIGLADECMADYGVDGWRNETWR